MLWGFFLRSIVHPPALSSLSFLLFLPFSPSSPPSTLNPLSLYRKASPLPLPLSLCLSPVLYTSSFLLALSSSLYFSLISSFCSSRSHSVPLLLFPYFCLSLFLLPYLSYPFLFFLFPYLPLFLSHFIFLSSRCHCDPIPPSPYFCPYLFPSLSLLCRLGLPLTLSLPHFLTLPPSRFPYPLAPFLRFVSFFPPTTISV